MSELNKEAVIDREYIDWLLELASAPGIKELRDGVCLKELVESARELDRIIVDITDPQLQRRLRRAICNVNESYEKLGFCIGHLAHERGV